MSSTSAQTGVTSRRMGSQTVLMALRANGEEFPIEASISQHTEDAGKLFTVILRDVTRARARRRAAGAQRGAPARHPRFGDGRDHHRRRAASTSCCSMPRRRRCSAARASEAIGAPLAWFIPERFRAGHADHVRRFGETGVSSRRMGAQRIVTGLRRNGEEFPIDASISQISEQRAQVLHGDPARRHRARAGGGSAAGARRKNCASSAPPPTCAREQEKSRIARELHDELGQALTALQMDVAWCKQKLPARRSRLAGKLDEMADAARRRRSRPRGASRPTCGR